MKRTLIVSIPMKAEVVKSRYVSADPTLPAGSREAAFPVVPFLEAAGIRGDEMKVILIAKHSAFSHADEHVAALKEELAAIGVSATFVTVDSEFEEKRDVHEKLMLDLVKEIEDGSKLIADVTYGSKDVPVVIFSAMNFAEKFLGCEVENILYGQAFFRDDGSISETRLCDLSPLYTLNHLAGVLKCDSPEKARQLLRKVISI